MRMRLRKQLANFLRQRRGNLTYVQFAIRTGISDSTLWRLEECATNCSLETLILICRAFNCTLQDIFPDEFAKTNADHTGLKPNRAPKPVWTPYREPEDAPIRPVMAFLGFILAQIGLFCRLIKVIPPRNKAIA